MVKMFEEEMGEQFTEMFKVLKKQIPLVAESIKLLFDELIKLGFTREEAITICANYKLAK